MRGASSEVNGDILNTYFPVVRKKMEKRVPPKEKKKHPGRGHAKGLHTGEKKVTPRWQLCTSKISPECLRKFFTNVTRSVCVKCHNYQKPL